MQAHVCVCVPVYALRASVRFLQAWFIQSLAISVSVSLPRKALDVPSLSLWTANDGHTRLKTHRHTHTHRS